MPPQPSSASKSRSQPPGHPRPSTSEELSTSDNPPTSEAEGGDHTDVKTEKRLEAASVALRDLEKGAQKYINPGPPRTLNKLTTSADSVMKGVADTQGSELASNVEAASKSDDLKAIREGVNMFVDSLPELLKVLQGIASIYPFIGVAVGAFSAVIKLHVKRQDNDKQINVLFVQMRDTMKVLVLLGDIGQGPPIEQNGPKTIEVLLEGLVQKTADDIKECANVCDAYAKKGTVARAVRSYGWEAKLKQWIERFAKREKDLTLALSTHTSVGIVEVDRKLAGVDVKMDMVLKWFSVLVSPEQQALTDLVNAEQFGGPEKVIADPTKLRDLLKRYRPATTAASQAADGSQRNASGTAPKGSERLDDEEFARVKRELSDSPEQAIQHNSDVFERKFQMQQKEMKQIVHQEGDRVIEAVTGSGAHTKINDPDIREIWREMQWPGHVKARHFVLALRDYYRQVIDGKRNAADKDATSSRVANSDKWTLEWINVSRLQAITEAFDDDASGFITIAEVNNFTASRPKDWSLLHWLAYWAIGWQMTATQYRDEITTICAKMFAIRPYLHPSNREAVNTYLRTVWPNVSPLTSSLTANAYRDDYLEERFRSYVEVEEQRLREGLETVKYGIDGLDTLSLVTGQGRIEKYLFPLLSLLLRRDLKIIRLCQNQVIHVNELSTSTLNIICVFNAVAQRHDDLQALFKQQKLDPAQQFKVFACKLLSHWNDRDTFFSLKNLQKTGFTEIEYVEIGDSDDQEINTALSELLLYPSVADTLYSSVSAEDVATAYNPVMDAAVRLIVGRWSGFQYSASETRYTYPMRTFHLYASQGGTACEASGINFLGAVFTVSVEHATPVDSGTIEYTFTYSQSGPTDFTGLTLVVYMTGTLDEDGKMLSGRWGYEKDDQPHPFILWRALPLVTITSRPHPEEFKKDKPRTLWKYALTAARNEACQKLFSWSYIKERRDMRREFLELRQKLEDQWDMSPEDWLRLGDIHKMSTADDVRWFYLFYERQHSRTLVHDDRSCDACGAYPIRGTRVVCLQCVFNDDAFDFCDKPACLGCAVNTPRLLASSHLPTHDFVKIRTVVLDKYEIGSIIRNATGSLEWATKLLDIAEKGGKDEEEAQWPPHWVPWGIRWGQEWEGPQQDRMARPTIIDEGAKHENQDKGGSEDRGEAQEVLEENEGVSKILDGGEEEDTNQSEVMVEDKNREEPEDEQIEDENEDQPRHAEDMTLACLRCEALVSRPCLYCIDCRPWFTTRRFICWDCDQKVAGFNDGKYHKATHHLVCCISRAPIEPTEESLTVEKRLGSLEAKVEGLTSQMGEIKELLQTLVHGRTADPCHQ